MKLVAHNGSRVWGGNEKWLATLASGLLKRGHQVVVSCRADGPVRDALAERRIPTSPIRPRGELDLISAVRFGAWLQREQPDALLLTSWNRTASAARAGRRAGVGRVVVRLGIVRSFPVGGRFAAAFRDDVDAMIVNSPEIRDAWLASAPNFDEARVHVVLNGIQPRPDDGGAARQAVRAELGTGPEARLVAGVGHVTHRKGFDLLLDAFAQLGDPGAELVIVGTGPAEAELRRRARGLGVAGRVHWAGHRGDVPEVLAACDAFVLSSRNEGMANVMLEAMAAGTPVVATRISGVWDAIGPVRGRPPAGWIVPPENASAMAGAIGAALGNRPEARVRAAEGRWRITEWFSVDRMVSQAERVLFPGTHVRS